MYITNKNKVFKQKEIDKAIKHCQDHYPNEAGGVFDNDGKFVPIDNLSDDPTKCYQVDASLINVMTIENQINCFIHSHCDEKEPLASKEDQRAQKEFDLPYCIINLRNKSCTHVIFWGGSYPMEPLVGRPFFYGVWDCLNLVRDYVLVNEGYELPSPPRDWVFWFKGKRMFEDYIPKEYMEVDKKNLKENDILMYTLKDTKAINHVGVLTENNRVLHHFHQCISNYYPLSHCMGDLKKIYRRR